MSSSTSGWSVCVGGDSTEETTEFWSSDRASAAAVSTGGGGDVTDTSWASESPVWPGDEVGNTCTCDTIGSSNVGSS